MKKKRRKVNGFRVVLISTCCLLTIVLVCCLSLIGIRVMNKDIVEKQQPKVLQKVEKK